MMKSWLGLICVGSVLGAIFSAVWAFWDHGTQADNTDAVLWGMVLATVFSGLFAASAVMIAALSVWRTQPKGSE